ncbi:hypothetical protein PsYK624_062310 [Phanerochaete sordida]|uniref:Uncharacterized protein n=1 Tax=Phanerochaete sordida TaxID=48140 RepID=A0A9P3G6E1_9APHY|nr:hypothetical protein PsYK624_062310 [Phanerochaete sordida]
MPSRAGRHHGYTVVHFRKRQMAAWSRAERRLEVARFSFSSELPCHILRRPIRLKVLSPTATLQPPYRSRDKLRTSSCAGSWSEPFRRRILELSALSICKHYESRSTHDEEEMRCLLIHDLLIPRTLHLFVFKSPHAHSARGCQDTAALECLFSRSTPRSRTRSSALHSTFQITAKLPVDCVRTRGFPRDLRRRS